MTIKKLHHKIRKLQIKRPETPYSDGPPCIELMHKTKSVKADEQRIVSLWCVRKK